MRGSERELVTIDVYRALVGSHDTCDDLHGRALAGAILPEECVDLARMDCDRSASQGLDAAVVLAQVARVKRG